MKARQAKEAKSVSSMAEFSCW